MWRKKKQEEEIYTCLSKIRMTFALKAIMKPDVFVDVISIETSLIIWWMGVSRTDIRSCTGFPVKRPSDYGCCFL